jgi:hypothetical protein
VVAHFRRPHVVVTPAVPPLDLFSFHATFSGLGFDAWTGRIPPKNFPESLISSVLVICAWDWLVIQQAVMNNFKNVLQLM